MLSTDFMSNVNLNYKPSNKELPFVVKIGNNRLKSKHIDLRSDFMPLTDIKSPRNIDLNVGIKKYESSMPHRFSTNFSSLSKFTSGNQDPTAFYNIPKVKYEYQKHTIPSAYQYGVPTDFEQMARRLNFQGVEEEILDSYTKSDLNEDELSQHSQNILKGGQHLPGYNEFITEFKTKLKTVKEVKENKSDVINELKQQPHQQPRQQPRPKTKKTANVNVNPIIIDGGGGGGAAAAAVYDDDATAAAGGGGGGGGGEKSITDRYPGSYQSIIETFDRKGIKHYEDVDLDIERGITEYLKKVYPKMKSDDRNTLLNIAKGNHLTPTTPTTPSTPTTPTKMTPSQRERLSELVHIHHKSRHSPSSTTTDSSSKTSHKRAVEAIEVDEDEDIGFRLDNHELYVDDNMKTYIQSKLFRGKYQYEINIYDPEIQNKLKEDLDNFLIKMYSSMTPEKRNTFINERLKKIKQSISSQHASSSSTSEKLSPRDMEDNPMLIGKSVRKTSRGGK
jgi:hypothetical protein